MRLNFGGEHFTTDDGLQMNIRSQLDRLEREFDLSTSHSSTAERFAEIIRATHKVRGERVVVLVDEDDKLILDDLHVPEIARANRDYLRGLYAVIKDCDAHIHFSFITGVSKFSKASLFSCFNNLIDITIDSEYSSICGYTESDLEAVFTSELSGLDRDRIRDWYHGYSWRGNEKVDNPFDILLLFRNCEFHPYWFETGTPTFLVELLLRRRVSSVDLNSILASSEMLISFDVDLIEPEALLFQTGYLTIEKAERLGDETFYRLAPPNREVHQGLNRSLLSHLVGGTSVRGSNSARLFRLLRADDVDGLREVFHAFYASIPYEWFMKNDIGNYEGYYANVFYSYFADLGLDVVVEDSTNRGRLDMALRFQGRVYVFEFKVVEQAGRGKAMAQLKQKGYEEKYRYNCELLYLIAVEFSSESRNIVSFEVEQV